LRQPLQQLGLQIGRDALFDVLRPAPCVAAGAAEAGAPQDH